MNTSNQIPTEEKNRKILVNAIQNGTVIDHIPSKVAVKIIEILDIRDETTTIGFNLSSKLLGSKAIIKISDRFLGPHEVNTIALLAPLATMNIIQDYRVIEKKNVVVPPCVEGLITCSNPNCITNKNPVTSRFHVKKVEPMIVKCHYCERTMKESELNTLLKRH